MSTSEGGTVEGSSRLGFSFATRDAVKKYKEKTGHKKGERVRVRIVAHFVVFENPVRDYIVQLGPSD
jgi:hypothetical protein